MSVSELSCPQVSKSSGGERSCPEQARVSEDRSFRPGTPWRKIESRFSRTLPPLKTKNPLIASASSDILLVHM